MSVPIVIAKQSAAYVDANAAEAPAEDARSFAAFLLQGGINECAAGAKPPGLFYLVNLHPYARLSASMNLLDDHGARVGVLTPNLSPLSATRVALQQRLLETRPHQPAPPLKYPQESQRACPAAPPPEPKPPTPEHREPQPSEAPRWLPCLWARSCAHKMCAQAPSPPGWIKINDAWNPTVCGNPASITYNVWTLQQLSDQPVGAVIHACKGTVPSGWTLVGTAWNPTVCGHPATNQSNVMVIKRLD